MRSSLAAVARGRDVEPPRRRSCRAGACGDRELARRRDLVREELTETIHLNESSVRRRRARWRRLFAAIDAEEARSPRRQRSFDLGSRISEFLSSFTPRTLAWSATAAAVAILVQAAVITSILVKEQGASGVPVRERAERRLFCGRALCPAGDRERNHQFPRRL